MILDHGHLKCFGDINDIAPIYEQMTQEDPEEIAKREEQARKNRARKLRASRKTKGRDIIRMTNNLGITPEQAMAALDIPEEKYQIYRDVISDIEENEGMLTKQEALKQAAAEEAEIDREATFPDEEEQQAVGDSDN